MSIDLNWEALTTGPDGLALAEQIRDFIHDKFQTIPLPRFIKSVTVQSFDLGTVVPDIEIKDICDPLPDFYEETADHLGDSDTDFLNNGSKSRSTGEEVPRESRRIGRDEKKNGSSQSITSPVLTEPKFSRPRLLLNPGDSGSQFLSVNTPGIPGGTSNLNYFHLQLASGLSGTQTPLAAVAGVHLPSGWPDHSLLSYAQNDHDIQHPRNSPLPPHMTAEAARVPDLREKASVSTLATSGNTTRPHTRDGPDIDSIEDDTLPSPRHFHAPRIEDVQIVFRVRYSGDIKLSLTTEILLDYPMPSFVGIPVMLNITGMSFDGVAVLAYIQKRAHFCFLSPEDAFATIGEEEPEELNNGMKLGGLLHEIKVESEIGQRENGKQVLKNVGKVERFVLEQVRRMFEDEFVYPSFWTFLV